MAEEDPDNPPFTQDDLIRDAVLSASTGLALGLWCDVLARPKLLAVFGRTPVLILEWALRLALHLPAGAWLLIGVLMLSGFGALFFKAGPERGLVRVFAFGFALMAGRLLLMP